MQSFWFITDGPYKYCYIASRLLVDRTENPKVKILLQLTKNKIFDIA